MPNSYAVVRIDARLMEQLRIYGSHTGVPANRCVNEAVSDWIQTTAGPLLEYHGVPAREIKQFLKGGTLDGRPISHREIKRKPQRMKA